MSMIDASSLIEIFANISTRMAEERDYLCELDGNIGDADHGIAMTQGFAAVERAITELDPQSSTLTEILNTTARSFLNAIGASTGPLYATAFMRAGKWAADRKEIPHVELPQILVAIAQGISNRGKAKLGDKTMFDVWGPVAIASEAGKSKEELVALAYSSAEATRGMSASLGRAARLGDRSIGHLDPGAVSAAMIIDIILKR